MIDDLDLGSLNYDIRYDNSIYKKHISIVMHVATSHYENSQYGMR